MRQLKASTLGRAAPIPPAVAADAESDWTQRPMSDSPRWTGGAHVSAAAVLFLLTLSAVGFYIGYNKGFVDGAVLAQRVYEVRFTPGEDDDAALPMASGPNGRLDDGLPNLAGASLPGLLTRHSR